MFNKPINQSVSQSINQSNRIILTAYVPLENDYCIQIKLNQIKMYLPTQEIKLALEPLAGIFLTHPVTVLTNSMSRTTLVAKHYTKQLFCCRYILLIQRSISSQAVYLRC